MSSSVFDLRQLVKHVSAAGKAPAGDVAAVWGALCNHIAERVLAGTGVALPGLGSFVPGPAFLVDPSVGGSLSAQRGGVPLDGPCVTAPLNFAAVAARAGVARHVSTSTVRALCACVSGHLHARTTLALDFGVGVLTQGGGYPVAFTFSDAFLARCGKVPNARSTLPAAAPAPGATTSSLDAGGAAFPAHPAAATSSALLTRECALLVAACRSGDTGSRGVVPRVTVEALLRGPCAGAVNTLDALSLLRLLDDCTEAPDGGVRYFDLAAALSDHVHGNSGTGAHASPQPRHRAMTAAAGMVASPLRTSSRSAPPAKQEMIGMPAPPAPPQAPLPAPNDAFMSRRGVDAYNDVLRASSRALLAATGGVAPKITATMPVGASQAVIAVNDATSSSRALGGASRAAPRSSTSQLVRQGVPLAVAPPRDSLAAVKRAEVAADAARMAELRRLMEQEAQESVAAKLDKQRALRAMLDDQVAARIASRAATPAVAG